MTISSTAIRETDTAEIASLVARALGSAVTAIDRIGGGRNSRVHRVTCARGQYVVKQYETARLDGRSRLDIEFSALRFLWEHGVRNIPQPIVADPEQGCAVYAYLDGHAISTQDLAESDLDDAVSFLARLNTLKETPEGRSFPPASEACFSVWAIVDNIEQRLHRLTGLRRGEAPSDALAEFLTQDFLPSRDRILRWCSAHLETFGSSFHAVLPEQDRTLSPSDFGFHNAVRLTDGRIGYCDFEYFGWDDPAKLIVDFVIHPAMALPIPLGRQMVAKLLKLFEEDPQLARRVEVVYPLFGLKWCLILLNEFVPEDLHRRGFAKGTVPRTSDLQMAQLAKTKQAWRRIMSEYEQFPYRV